MTSSGVGLVNTDSNDGDIVAVPRDTTVTVNSLDGKTMFGLVFVEDEARRGAEVKPIQITIGANGVGTYAMIDDADSGALSATETGSFTLTEAGNRCQGRLCEGHRRYGRHQCPDHVGRHRQ